MLKNKIVHNFLITTPNTMNQSFTWRQNYNISRFWKIIINFFLMLPTDLHFWIIVLHILVIRNLYILGWNFNRRSEKEYLLYTLISWHLDIWIKRYGLICYFFLHLGSPGRWEKVTFFKNKNLKLIIYIYIKSVESFYFDQWVKSDEF